MIEETVQAGAVDVQVFTVQDAQTQRITVPRETAAVIRIIESRVGWVGAVSRIRIWLVVPIEFS